MKTKNMLLIIAVFAIMVAIAETTINFLKGMGI
jgi:hypothetical protein